MASIVLKKVHLTVNSVDLSAEIQQISFDRSKDLPQTTAMGDDSHEYLADGLKNSTMTVTFRGDYTAGSVDASLDVMYDLTAAFTYILRPKTDVIGVTNPEFTGSTILQNYGPIAGSVGDQAAIAATFQNTGDVARAVA